MGLPPLLLSFSQHAFSSGENTQVEHLPFAKHLAQHVAALSTESLPGSRWPSPAVQLGRTSEQLQLG